MKVKTTLIMSIGFLSAGLFAAPQQFQGSDTLAGAMREAIQRSNLSQELEYVGGGSGKGEAAMIEGKQDIAPMSREITPDAAAKLAAKGKKSTAHVIALDGIALFVNVRNRLSVLDLDTIRKIYLCEIRKWEQIPFSQTKGEIRVYRRDDSSGTTDLVKHVLGIKTFGECAKVAPTAEEITQATASEEAAIGFGGLSAHLVGKNHPLAISLKNGAKGVYPTVDTIRNRTYPLSRNLYFYEVGMAADLSSAEQALLRNVTDRKFMDPIVQKFEFFTIN